MRTIGCILAIATAAATFSACKEEVSNAANIQRMNDTIFTLYPTVNRVSVEVREREDVIITLGDAELFNAGDAKQQEVSNELGKLSVFFFGKDNQLHGGKVIFAKDETNLEVKEEDKKEVSMPASVFHKE